MSSKNCLTNIFLVYFFDILDLCAFQKKKVQQRKNERDDPPDVCQNRKNWATNKN